MKIICSQSELENKLSYVLGATTTRSSMDILSNFFISAKDKNISIIGTNLEIFVKAILKEEYIEIEKDGEICVDAMKLYKIIKALPKKVNILLELNKEDRVDITVVDDDYDMKYNLANKSIIDFPEFKYPEEKKQILKLNQIVLKDMIKKVLYATDNKETRYILCGMFIDIKKDNVKFVSTDGRRLAKIEYVCPFDDEINFIVPNKTLLELIKLLNASNDDCIIYYENNKIYFEIGDIFISSITLEGSFPDYNAVIPKSYTKKIIVNNLLLKESLDRLINVVNTLSNIIKVDIDKNIITLDSNTDGTGGNEIIKMDNNIESNITIGFNIMFLKQVVDLTEENEIEINFNNYDNPVMIRGKDNEDYINIIMPVKL